MEENAGTPADGPWADDKKAEQPLPEWAIPARRSDDIGRLAWQLIEGGKNGMPDFSAAGPLFDALLESGDAEAAYRFRKNMVSLLESLQGVVGRRVAMRNWLSGVQERTRETATHLLYDLNSTMSILARAAEIASEPAPAPVAEDSAASIVRADVGYSHIGQRVTLPDGRRGMVIEDTGIDGTSRILIDQGAK